MWAMRASARLRSVMSMAAISTAGARSWVRRREKTATSMRPPSALRWRQVRPACHVLGRHRRCRPCRSGRPRSWMSGQRPRQQVARSIAVMGDRRVVGREDAFVVDGADEHRHRIGVEQQAERGLALLHLGDVDAQADDAAVAGLALLDQTRSGRRRVPARAAGRDCAGDRGAPRSTPPRGRSAAG